MSVIPTRDQVPQIVRFSGGTSASRQAPAPGGGLTGKDVFRIIRKRWLLIVLSVVVCAAAATAVTLLWRLYAPLYTAFVYLGVNPPEQQMLAPPYPYGADVYDRAKMGAVQMAKSDEVLRKTIDDNRVKVTRWFRDNIQDAANQLEKATDILPIRETVYLRLAVTGRDPTEMAKIVDVWSQVIVEDAMESANRDRKEQIDKITIQEEALKREKVDKEAIINNLTQSDERIIQQELASRTAELQLLTGELLKAGLAKENAASQKKMIEEMENMGQLDRHPQVSQMVENDPVLRGMTQETKALESSLAQLRINRDSRHRLVLEMESRLETLKAQAASREEEIRRLSVNQVKDYYDQQLRMATAQETVYDARVTEVKVRVTALDDSLKNVTRLSAERRALETNIDMLDRRLLELKLLQKAFVPVYIRRAAFIPTQPSTPRWGVNLPLGVVLGLVIGFGLTFLLEFMDTSIRSPSDVSRRVDLPMLGMVPHLADLEEDIKDLRLAFMTNPNSLIGESFRQVRTTLQFSAPAAQLRSILVTSAMPGDGRSTVTLNLAAATAHSGRKVLVVEANFRQPVLRGLFPQAPEAGLSNVLVGQSHWKDLICEVHPNLFVLAGGPLPPNPAELLGSEAMRTLLSELSVEFDQVFFDGAPCVLVTDPAVLATLVDGVVLVVRATANTYGVVQRARDLLARVGARIFGVVLNGIRVTAGGYLRKNYRTFYEYHAQAETEAPQQLTK